MPPTALTYDRAAKSVPPHVWFAVSAVFHYLGPSFAVLLFPSIGVLGVAWMRIATAAAVFAPFTHPWKTIGWPTRGPASCLSHSEHVSPS